MMQSVDTSLSLSFFFVQDKQYNHAKAVGETRVKFDLG